MKHKVNISTYSFIVSVIGIAILGGTAFFAYSHGKIDLVFLVLGALIILCITALFYAPISIEVKDNALLVNRSLWVKKIPLSEIKSIELLQPTMGARRLWGSGGWFGYWGWFSERDLGKYFAYYGKASDCFFVRLNNGRQYMLGCKNPQAIVEYISDKISK